jgi:hypothetical protein
MATDPLTDRRDPTRHNWRRWDELQRWRQERGAQRTEFRLAQALERLKAGEALLQVRRRWAPRRTSVCESDLGRPR